MKKLLLLLIAIATFTMASAQKAETVVENYKSKGQYVPVDKSTITMMLPVLKQQLPEAQYKAMEGPLKKMGSLQLLVFGPGKDDVYQSFQNDILSLLNNGYERKDMQPEEGNSPVCIIKTENGLLKEVVICDKGTPETGPVMMFMKGEFSSDDIDALSNLNSGLM